jgi:predicted PurR-regulated permease PerM
VPRVSREHLFAAFFFAVFVFLLYQLALFLAPFFAPLVWAGILALTFYPLTDRLARLCRGRRDVAAFLLVLVVVAIVVLPSIYLGSLAVRQASAAYARVQDMARSGEFSRLIDEVRGTRVGLLWQRLTAPLADKVALDPASLLVAASNWLSQELLGQTTALARNMLVTLMDFLLMLVALFFFFRDGERMAGRFRDLLPMAPEHKQVIFTRLYETLSAVVQSMIVTAVAQGTLAGIGYWLIADVPFKLFLAVGTGLASFLPLAGPAFVWGGVAGYLALTGFRGEAILLALWGVFVVSMADNLIKPLFIGGRARLPTFLLLFSLLGGIAVYGFLGIFLAPVVLAALLAFTDIYRELYAAPTAKPAGDHRTAAA